MKCKQIIKKYGHLRQDALPSDIRAFVEQDEICRAWFANTEAQRNLLSLKQHEKPEPALHGRVTYNVRVRIQAGEQLPTPELNTPRATALWFPGVTAAALVVFGVTYTFTQLDRPGNGSSEQPTIALEQVPEERAAPSQQRIEDLFKPIPTETNQHPHMAGNTNVFPKLVPSDPGRTDTRRVVGPPIPK